jgi:predicted flap endonuclease-1-like 5' DNA nuclease
MILISQILGCLIVAAGIGGAVGWLLQYLPTRQLTQQFRDLTATLRLKEQRLEKAQYELKVQTASMHMLESKTLEAETLLQSTRQEVSTQQNRLQALQQELAFRTEKLAALEAEGPSASLLTNEHETAVVSEGENVRRLHLVRQDAEQALESHKQEQQDLQHRVTELETAVAETALLRARVEELEPAQGRVHWLEVQLSERDVEHRTALHQRDDQLAERDRKICELERLQPQVQEREAALAQREIQHAHALAQQEAQIAKLQKQLAAQDTVGAQLLLNEKILRERDERIDGLQRQIQGFEAQQQGHTAQAKIVEEKEEEIARLRKRLVEVRAALRIKTDGEATAPRQSRQNGSQLSLLSEQTQAAHTAKEGQKDDLSKIHGIGPAFAKTLNKMGLHTYVQIARWKPEDIDKVAKKLYTAPERIKRDKWVEEAKKEHYRKYGERL